VKTKRQLQIEAQAMAITGAASDSAIVSAFCIGAFWADNNPKPKEVQNAFELCVCGHRRNEHIYHEGHAGSKPGSEGK